jgi:hypothetical protein
MSALRLVADDRAGPAAIGILVPPSRRTVLIVRPRSLPLDLLVLAESGGTAFREFEREQASRAAEALFDALRERAGSSPVHVEWKPAAGALSPDGYLLRVHVGPFHLLACDRRPGRPYEPLAFADLASARSTAERVTQLLCPLPGNDQEVYLNTRNFQR